MPLEPYFLFFSPDKGLKLRKNAYLLLCVIVGLAFQACTSSKNWPENKYLLHKQIVKGNEETSSDEIVLLFRQKPNRKIGPFLPYVWIYNVGKKLYKPEKIKDRLDKVEDKFDQRIRKAEDKDKKEKARRLLRKKEKKVKKLRKATEEGNWLMRAVGEEPVFYDSLEVNLTREEIVDYLQAHGFFQSEVAVQTDTVLKRRIKVKYLITENQPTYFGLVDYVTTNPRMDSLLKVSRQEAEIIPGERYSEDKIAAERARITDMMENNGYLLFSNQYITFQVDTLHFHSDDTLVVEKDSLLVPPSTVDMEELPERSAHVTLIINNPRRGRHRAYQIDEVFFHIVNSREVGQNIERDTLSSSQSSIDYVYEGERLDYAHPILDRRIRLREGEMYSRLKTQETQRSLGILDMFKFVNINPDTSQGKVDMHIYTTPLEKYQLGSEVGFNVIQGLPGPFTNLSLKNRNIFRGAEVFETNFRLAIDGQSGFSQQNQFYSSQEVGLNSSITFPKILFPISQRLRNRLDDYNPTTRLSLGFNFVRRPEYTRTNFSGAISYQGQRRYSIYNLTLAELNVVDTRSISPEFRQILNDLTSSGNPIIESFDQALVSNINASYIFNNTVRNESRPSVYFRLGFEGGGLTQSIISQTRLIENARLFGLKIFQYWRLNPTVHYYVPLNRQYQSLAFRLNTGVARSFGLSSTLPYEKFFFAGGGSSIRAWQPRRLGPGSARPQINEDGTFDYRFEQPGEIILEANAEYRFPLISYLRGALFIDAGNVWTFRPDPNRPGSDFSFRRFWREIAVGTGFGFRFNLPFLLFRLDFGLKVYDPAREARRRWIIGQFDPLNPFANDLLLINIGIGYPF